jgi:hypothetical protein
MQSLFHLQEKKEKRKRNGEIFTTIHYSSFFSSKYLQKSNTTYINAHMKRFGYDILRFVSVLEYKRQIQKGLVGGTKTGQF